MQVRRVLKTLLAKWMVIALVAAISGAAGWILASNHNDGIRPRWRAQAPVTFFQLEEEDDSSSSSGNNRSAATTSSTADAETERARAGLLLEETLAANPRLSIVADREENTLLFVAVGRDGEETLAEALALRDAYQALGATVLSVDQIEATMATVLVDIDRLKEKISSLEVGEPPPEPPALVAQRTVLEAEIAKLDQRQAEISIWILNPELRPTEEEFNGVEADATRAADETEDTEPPPIVTLATLEAARDENDVVLVRLRGELDRIPDPPEVEALDVDSALELEALQLDLDELELQYVNLFRRLDGRPPGGFLEEPIVSDETQSTRSVGLSAMLGLLVGGFLAGLAVIGLDQIRQPVWAASDLEGITTLGFVNRKRETDSGEVVWYPTALTQRRRDIQTLRAVTDGVTDERSAVIGFFGVGVAGEEVGELAADLAASYTVADRDVLLIDGNSFHPNTLPEFGTGANRLNDVLMTPWPLDIAAERIHEFLDNAVPSAPGLTALYVDAEAHDPIDVFASPNCRTLMEVVAERYDMIVVAGPDIADPLADTVIHRVDFVTLVGYVGYTERSRIETAAVALADRKVTVAGAALLEGRRQPVRDQLSQYLRGSRDDEDFDRGDAVQGAEDEEITVTLPKPAPIPTGSGKNAKAETAENGSDEVSEESAAAPTEEESVLAKAKAKRAESKSGNR